MAVIKAKAMAASILGLAMLGTIVVALPPQGEVQPSDTQGYYKAKCGTCHGQKAEKKFDIALPEDQLVDAVLKGKKAEKPPNMPGFEAKGVNADQAKALVTLMKQLKESAPAQ